MRIVLQHAGNALYFQNPGIWTADLGEAHDFGTSERAQEFVRASHLTGVRLVAAFVDGRWLETVALPLGAPTFAAAAATLGRLG